jgi:uroporphyrinogen-III synthase
MSNKIRYNKQNSNPPRYPFSLPLPVKQTIFSLQYIYVTRELRADGPFFQTLSRYNFRIEGHSLIRFEAVPFEDIPLADWIFFYSQNAVTFFFRRVKETGIPLSPDLKWGGIGPATTRRLKKFGIRADFSGSGPPVEVARQFLPLAKNRRVLFPRAAQSRQSIQKVLAGQIEVLDLIVYINRIDQEAARPEADILVFTSPLNAKAYFEYRQPTEKTEIIAIGSTTAAALQDLGVEKVVTAPEPSEEGLAKAVLRVARLPEP